MKGPKQLLESEDNWVTRMGAWFPGKRVVFRGKDLFQDLKNIRWMTLFLYGITGRIFNDDQVKLFEGIWTICTSYPDSRIWNNQVAALAGTSRSTASLGISAAIAVSEASIYGYKPMVSVFDLLVRMKKKIQSEKDLEKFITIEKQKYRIIPGYGRPIVDGDERIVPLMKLSEELGYSSGEYVKLAFQIENILFNKYNKLKMNVAALMAALVADQGLTSRQYYYYVSLCFTGGIAPCFIDAIDHPEGTFLPFRCERLIYEGRPRRQWSKKSS